MLRTDHVVRAVGEQVAVVEAELVETHLALPERVVHLREALDRHAVVLPARAPDLSRAALADPLADDHVVGERARVQRAGARARGARDAAAGERDRAPVQLGALRARARLHTRLLKRGQLLVASRRARIRRVLRREELIRVLPEFVPALRMFAIVSQFIEANESKNDNQ